MAPPDHHKEVAKFLKEKFEGNASISAYRDEGGERPVPIGNFGGSFFSTIGAFDSNLSLPDGSFEFAATGDEDWLPNVLASSIYWLRERNCDSWPLVCEDVVKQNVNSQYRHMAFTPSPFGLQVSTGQVVHWFLGAPIKDSEIGISQGELLARVRLMYPKWLFSEPV